MRVSAPVTEETREASSRTLCQRPHRTQERDEGKHRIWFIGHAKVGLGGHGHHSRPPARDQFTTQEGLLWTGGRM